MRGFLRFRGKWRGAVAIVNLGEVGDFRKRGARDLLETTQLIGGRDSQLVTHGCNGSKEWGTLSSWKLEGWKLKRFGS